MEDYAISRREYVKQIRASFDQPTKESYNNYGYASTEAEEYPVDTTFFSLKIRLTIAIILFCIVFFCEFNSYTVFDMEVAEIIDMIRDKLVYNFNWQI